MKDYDSKRHAPILTSCSSMPKLKIPTETHYSTPNTTRSSPSPFKLKIAYINKWMSRKFHEEPYHEESEYDFVEEEPEEEKTPVNKPQGKPGLEAMREFHANYKSITKSVSPFHYKTRSAAYEYLKEIEQLRQLPKPMGIAKWRGPPTELNLNAYKMGNSYACALSKGLKLMAHETVKLSDNRLTEKGTLPLIRELKHNIKYLDISYNFIGTTCAKELGDFIKTRAINLRGLNLENTHLGDIGTIELCNLLVDHPRLMEINLARNNITDLSCKSIATLIHDTFYLLSLNLHWNTIRGEGAALILQAVMQNGNIKVLDLSWNTIGATKSKTFPVQMAELLAIQENLVHLDISNNRLSSEDCLIIAKGLAENHTLWGIHVIGNDAKIDSKGFMLAGKAEQSMANGHLTQRINGRAMVLNPLSEENAKEREVDNCWICEGWNEVLFEWPKCKLLHNNDKVANTEKPEPVYLHIECDKYRPDLMYNDPTKDVYTLWRMCPPGKCKFFYTVEGKAVISPAYPSISFPLNMRIKLNDELYPYVNVALSEVNAVTVKANPDIVKENYEIGVQNAVPRPELGYFLRPKHKKGRPPWSFPKSVFRDYVPDSEELLQKCFEEDWRRMGKPKIKENQLASCKAVLKKSYKILRETYKYYAAIGRTESLFAINKLTLSDFIAHKIFLYEGDRLADMDIVFMTIKGRPKVAKNQPKTALVRFEFMETLLRLALKKYYDTKETQTESEAVEKLLANHILPHCSQFNCQYFRDTRYWNEECDNVLKSHYPLFENIYLSHSGSHRLPGEKNFMAFDEYLGIFSECSLINDIFTEREAISSFAQSMMTQIDELDSDRHMKMQMVEFLEAISRAAETLSLPPQDVDPEEWTLEKRQNQILGAKLDNMIPFLMVAAKKEFRERFKRPERDPNTGLYFETLYSGGKD